MNTNETTTQNQDVINMPRLGEPAPEFRAMTTMGKINFPSDFTGKWKILFSHPADFTPVCTTEFIAFAKMKAEFDALNTQLVGLSIDGLQSHIAWIRSIKENVEWNGERGIDINFPIITDISMKVAKLYGMIQPGMANTQTVRAVFFIDPENVMRAMIYYPMSLGRNFDEIKRVIQALQVADESHVSTPANWRPGDNVVVGAPQSAAEAAERKEGKDSSLTCHEWYLCSKKL